MSAISSNMAIPRFATSKPLLEADARAVESIESTENLAELGALTIRQELEYYKTLLDNYNPESVSSALVYCLNDQADDPWGRLSNFMSEDGRGIRAQNAFYNAVIAFEAWQNADPSDLPKPENLKDLRMPEFASRSIMTSVGVISFDKDGIIIGVRQRDREERLKLHPERLREKLAWFNQGALAGQRGRVLDRQPKKSHFGGNKILFSVLALGTIFLIIWRNFGDGIRTTVTLPNENLIPPTAQKYVATEQTKVSPPSTPSFPPTIPATPTPDIEPPIDPFAVMEFDKGNWVSVTSIDGLAQHMLVSGDTHDPDLLWNLNNRGGVIGTLDGKLYVLSQKSVIQSILDRGGKIFVSKGSQSKSDPLNKRPAVFASDRVTAFILDGGEVIFPGLITTEDYLFADFTLDDIMRIRAGGKDTFTNRFVIQLSYNSPDKYLKHLAFVYPGDSIDDVISSLIDEGYDPKTILATFFQSTVETFKQFTGQN